MTKHTDDFKNINFADFMSSKGWDDLDLLFNTLSDRGIELAITAEEFLDNGDFETDEDASYNLSDIGHNMVWWGNWLVAKAAGFDELRDLGFRGIQADSDCGGNLVLNSMIGSGRFLGEWCRRQGVIYVSCHGLVEVTSASGNKRSDLRAAKSLLAALDRHHSYQR